MGTTKGKNRAPTRRELRKVTSPVSQWIPEPRAGVWTQAGKEQRWTSQSSAYWFRNPVVFLTVIATFKTTFTSPLLLYPKAVTTVQGESLSFLENSHAPVSLPVGISSKLCELNIPKAKLIFFFYIPNSFALPCTWAWCRRRTVLGNRLLMGRWLKRLSDNMAAICSR